MPRSNAKGGDIEILAESLLRGDPSAAHPFVAAISNTVRRSVLTVLGPQNSEVEDVTQEAIIGLLAALERFRGECTIAQFAGRVGFLTAMAARRRQRTQARWVVSEEPEERVPSGYETSPMGRLEAGRRREVLLRLLDELPDGTRDALILHFMLGHTAEEIAILMQVPVNTVWSRIRIGKARLRQKFSRNVALRETVESSEVAR